MRIAIGSAFRNSAGPHLSRYVNQLAKLKECCDRRGDTLRWIATEGDSRDNTRMEIMRFAEYLPISMELAIREHGGPVYASTEEPARMKALSYVGNGILESVNEVDDVLIYVESDLLWKPETLYRLIEQLEPGKDVIAPLIFAGEAFYDIWAFRKNGHRFGPFHPYHGDLDLTQPTAVDSAGSCLVMRAEVARQCRIIEDNALVGFCKDVWSKGFAIYCDPRERIYHP